MNREIERDHQWLADARRDALLKADAVQRELLARISQLEDAVDRVLAWADEKGADVASPPRPETRERGTDAAASMLLNEAPTWAR